MRRGGEKRREGGSTKDESRKDKDLEKATKRKEEMAVVLLVRVRVSFRDIKFNIK